MPRELIATAPRTSVLQEYEELPLSATEIDQDGVCLAQARH